MAAPIKTRPLAVEMGPPILGTPALPRIYWLKGARSSVVPNGTDHRILPLCISIACSFPHGGGLQGRPQGDSNVRRHMPKGAPRLREISSCGCALRMASMSLAGIKVTRCITFEVLTNTTLRPASTDNPPQLVPPPVKG